MAALTAVEIERYKRQLILKEIGGAGQQRLKSARVLVVGAGGLGSPLIMYLAAAGVGTLGIVDDDRVSLDNLHRQIIFTTVDVTASKVARAAAAVAALNPHVQVETFNLRITDANAREIVRGFDIVADGSDNFTTRYVVSDACYLERKPLVFAAVGPYDGYLTTFKPYERGEDGNPRPGYRCLFPEAPPEGLVLNCSEVGVIGSVVGVMGALQATEVIKEITGAGQSMSNRLLIYDAMEPRFEAIATAWDPANPLTGKAAAE